MELHSGTYSTLHLSVAYNGKAVPLHTMEAQGERKYSSYSFITSALDGGEWSASRPGRPLPPGKGPPVPLEEKSFCLCRESNLDRPVVQSVARHYTAWATRLLAVTIPTIIRSWGNIYYCFYVNLTVFKIWSWVIVVKEARNVNPN
jgi:hypothetical protein